MLPEVARLLPPTGVRRGSTIAVTGSTSLLLALLAGPSAAGAWCAVVGVPTLGAAAAAEAGVVIDRLALVPSPGRQWAETVAALVDGVDVVVARPPARLAAGLARRLAARVRDRGCVLVSAGSWDGAELTVSATGAQWHGVESGYGRLRSCRLDVRVVGRGSAARPRQGEMWLPAYDRPAVDLPIAQVPSSVELAPVAGTPIPVTELPPLEAVG